MVRGMPVFKIYCDIAQGVEGGEGNPTDRRKTGRKMRAQSLASLQDLNRRELQILAKEYGIRANLKSADIISKILQANGKPQNPPKPGVLVNRENVDPQTVKKASKSTAKKRKSSTKPVQSKASPKKRTRRSTELKSRSTVTSQAQQSFEAAKLKRMRSLVSVEAADKAAVRLYVKEQQQAETLRLKKAKHNAVTEGVARRNLKNAAKQAANCAQNRLNMKKQKIQKEIEDKRKKALLVEKAVNPVIKAKLLRVKVRQKGKTVADEAARQATSRAQRLIERQRLQQAQAQEQIKKKIEQKRLFETAVNPVNKDKVMRMKTMQQGKTAAETAANQAVSREKRLIEQKKAEAIAKNMETLHTAMAKQKELQKQLQEMRAQREASKLQLAQEAETFEQDFKKQRLESAEKRRVRSKELVQEALNMEIALAFEKENIPPGQKKPLGSYDYVPTSKKRRLSNRKLTGKAKGNKKKHKKSRR